MNRHVFAQNVPHFAEDTFKCCVFNQKSLNCVPVVAVDINSVISNKQTNNFTWIHLSDDIIIPYVLIDLLLAYNFHIQNMFNKSSILQTIPPCDNLLISQKIVFCT